MEQIKGALEENVLTAICWNADLASLLATKLDASIFSSREYRKIAEKAFAHLTRYGEPPRAHLADLLEDDLKRGSEGRLLASTLEQMEQLQKELQPEFVLTQVDAFIEKRRMLITLEAAADAVQAGDVEKAKKVLYQQNLAPKVTTRIELSNPDQMLSFMEERDEDYFPTGVEILDSRGIRPSRKTMYLFVAPAKKGKSWHLVNIGVNGITHRHKVLHVTLENSAELTAQRYVQSICAMTTEEAETVRISVLRKDRLGRCTGIDFENIDTSQIKPENRDRIRRKLRMLQMRPRLLIQEYPMASLTIEQYRALLDSLERNDNFVPDLVLVDYPDLMKIDSANYRLAVGGIFRELRGVATERNHALAAVTQGNRASGTAAMTTTAMVAEDWSKIGTADTIVTFGQTAEEKERGLARLMVAAARNQRDSFTTMITQSYATGQFCLDSVYMSKFVEAEANRTAGKGQDDDDD